MSEYSGSKQQFEDAMAICEKEVRMLVSKDAEYKGSWKKRRRSPYHMLARKWDRIENMVEGRFDDDLFHAIENDSRPEGILSDMHDLRNYLLLVILEAEKIKERKEKSQKE